MPESNGAEELAMKRRPSGPEATNGVGHQEKSGASGPETTNGVGHQEKSGDHAPTKPLQSSLHSIREAMHRVENG